MNRIVKLLSERTLIPMTQFGPEAFHKLVYTRMELWGIEHLDDYVKYLENHPEELAWIQKQLADKQTGLFLSLLESNKSFHFIPSMMHVMDGDGKIVTVSDLWLKKLGYASQDVIGRSLAEFVTVETRHKVELDCLKSLSDKGYCSDVSCTFIKKNGDHLPVLLSAYLERDEQKHMQQSYAVLTDVSGIHEYREDLEAATYFIKRIADTLPSVLFVYDLKEQKNLYVTKRMLQVLHYKEEEVSDYDAFLKEHVHPEDYERMAADSDKVMQMSDSDRLIYEYRIRDKHGQWHWFRSREKVFQRNDKGEVTQTVGIAQDVTEEKENAELLSQSEANVRILLNNTRHTFYLIGPDYKLIAYNRKARAEAKLIMGFDLSEGFDFRRMVAKELMADFTEHFKACLNGEQITVTRDIEIIPNYSRWFKIHYEPAKNGSGKVIGVTFSSFDITDEMHMKQALLESESRWKFALEGSNEAVWDWQLDTQTFFHSENLNQMFGYPTDKRFTRKDWLNHIHPEDRERALSYFQQYLNGALETYQQEYRLRTKNGTYLWILDRGKVVQLNEQGLPTRFIGTYSDITERKKQEQLLSASEQRYAQVLNSINAGVWEWHIGSEENYASLKLFDLLGYKRDEIPKSFRFFKQNLIHPDDVPLVKEALNEHFNAGKEYNLDYRLRLRDGTYKWFNVTGTTRFNSGGKPVHMIGSIIDIDKRKKAEATITQRDHLLRSINQNITEGLYRSLEDTRLVYVNKAFLNIFGYTKEEVQSPKFSTTSIYAHPEDQERLKQKILKKKGTLRNEEVLYRKKDGTTFWGLLSSQGSFDFKGNLYYDGAIRDITDQKKVNEELANAKVLAEEMNRLKSNFLANMSHEIRTPINGILGLTDVMRECEDMDDVQNLAAMVRESGERLLSTITGILNLSRLEAQKGEFELKPVPLNRSIEHSKKVFQLLAERRGITFNCILPDEKIEVLAEESMLDQVINNLVGNALKFTEKGSIQLSLTTETKGSTSMASLTVTDTGIGISEEFLPQVFNAFEQESSGTKRKYEGSGLGLSICKKYAELLGGTISVRSKLGKGSSFTMTLPMKD